MTRPLHETDPSSELALSTIRINAVTGKIYSV